MDKTKITKRIQKVYWVSEFEDQQIQKFLYQNRMKDKKDNIAQQTILHPNIFPNDS